MFRLQATGGVHKQKIATAGTGSTDGIKNNSSRIGVAAGVRDDRNITSLSPDFHLLHSSGSEGVGSGNQSAVTAANGKIREFSESGGLTNPIHPDQQPDVQGSPFGSQQLHTARPDRCIEKATELFLEETDSLARVNHLLIHALSESLQHLIRRCHTGIGSQEQRLQIVENLGSERVIPQILEQPRDESLSRLLQALTQSAEPVDLFERHLISPSALCREHFRRPGECIIKVAEAGLGGVLRRGRRRGRRRWCRLNLSRAGILILLTLKALSRGLLQQRRT